MIGGYRVRTPGSWFAFVLALAGAIAARGQGTVLLSQPHPTAAGNRCSVVYDDARQRLVMFCVAYGAIAMDSTFEWDGQRWTMRRSPTLPVVGDPIMVYDAARERTVYFTGTETWEWDGYRWNQTATLGSSPAPRWGHAMAYDASRQRVVLFGGSFSPSGVLQDTWEYDGSQWILRTPLASPPALTNHVMAYDRVRQRIVLLSAGSVPSTWVYDGLTWVNLSPPVSPPNSPVWTMTFDGSVGKVTLLTGVTPGTQVWSWDGMQWMQRPISGFVHGAKLAFDDRRGTLLAYHPNGEMYEAIGSAWVLVGNQGYPMGRRMVYDSTRRRAVLYSDYYTYTSYTPPYSVTFYQGYTFEWDGARWHEMPWGPSRGNPIVAYDTTHQYMLVFGGSALGGLSAETWTWNGTTWNQITTSPTPSPDAYGVMANDSARQSVVLFTSNGQTWEWSGGWAQRFPVHNPGIRTNATFVEDPVRQRLVLFGGTVLNNDTWEWNGVDWLLQTPATRPPARIQAVGFFDAARVRVVMHGGNGGSLGDTWEWDGTNWAQVVRALPLGSYPVVYFADADYVLVGTTSLEGVLVPADAAPVGTGCGGVARPPRLVTNTPLLGHAAFTVDVLQTAPSTAVLLGYAFQPASVPLGCGCTLYLDSSLAVIPLVADPSGAARLTLQLPLAPWLRGLSLEMQALAIDPAGSCAPVAMTQAVSLRFGN